ncbi:hypothetical protein ASZ78_006957 [Callipepla squamata]|uniref:Uncharacterized protein n=1 Tax=Callipepla squamata TaxID=9009 RepID=A0A226MUN9_CALSU|nr:hypothetical protein ASZ78_006957 [Callipepla squamata]
MVTEDTAGSGSEILRLFVPNTIEKHVIPQGLYVKQLEKPDYDHIPGSPYFLGKKLGPIREYHWSLVGMVMISAVASLSLKELPPKGDESKTKELDEELEDDKGAG